MNNRTKENLKRNMYVKQLGKYGILGYEALQFSDEEMRKILTHARGNESGSNITEN